MRKQIEFVASVGRDAGKNFRITEMAARKACHFGYRFVVAVGETDRDAIKGIDIGKVTFADFIDLVRNGIFQVNWGVLQGLIDEIEACWLVVPDPTNPELTKAVFEEDIEERETYNALIMKTVELHDFFTVAVN